jgi:hypothetical protein
MGDDWPADERYAVSYSANTEVAKNEAALAWFRGGRYQLVASVDTESLEEAYRLTPNLDDSWSRDGAPRITVLCPLPVVDGAVYGLKSTEVGDVCVMNEVVYRCAGVGWQWCGPVVQKEDPVTAEGR